MGSRLAQMGLYWMGSLNYLLNKGFDLVFIYLEPYFNYFKGLTNYLANCLAQLFIYMGPLLSHVGPISVT